MLRILIGYNGSDASNALLGDLCHAVVPERAEALVASVAELYCPPANIDEAGKRALLAANKIQKDFPNWSVVAETASGLPAAGIF